MFMRSPLHTRSARRDVHSSVRRSLARLSKRPSLGLAPSPTAFSMVRPRRRATRFTHLFEENLVVGLLLHLPLGPFLRARVKSRVGVVVRQSPSSHIIHPSARDPPRRRPLSRHLAHPSLASTDRTNARTRNHPHRSSSRRPRVVLASSTATHPSRPRPPASSLGSPLDDSHRRPRLARAHLGLLLTAGQSLGGLGGLRFGRFRRHLSFVCDARDREAASIARARPRGRGRPRARRRDRSAGHAVCAFSSRFALNTSESARLGFLCN